MDFSKVDDTVEVNGVVFHKPFVEKPSLPKTTTIYFPSDYMGETPRGCLGRAWITAASTLVRAT